MTEDAQEVRIEVFTWDEENEGHLTEFHPDIDPGDVDSVLESDWIWLPNVGEGRTAMVLVLGEDRGGRRLAIPADPTPVEGAWRPKTAHQMSRWHEETYDDAIQ